MHEGPDLSTTPPTPPQRVPTHDTLPATETGPGGEIETASSAAEAAEAAESDPDGSQPAGSQRLDADRPGAVSEVGPGAVSEVGRATTSGVTPGAASGVTPGAASEVTADGGDGGPAPAPAEAMPAEAGVDGLSVGAPVTEPSPVGSAVGAPDPGPAPRARWRMRALLAGGAAIAVLVAGLVVLRPGPAPDGAARAAASGQPAPSATSSAPVTPYDKAVAALDAQTAALVNGDENGWLAAVDPKLRARYRSLFRNLRGLGVSSLHYEPDSGQAVKGDSTAVAIAVDLVYCYTADMCPANPPTAWGKGPRIAQKLTLKPVGGAYVITAVGASPDPDRNQPTPWENGDLTFAQGRRVVFAAGAGEQKYLRTVLPVAEHAAAVADHYAALNGTPQKRYRIFLASEKQWKTWYGGEDDRWAIGLAVPLNKRGIDVIIRMAKMDDPLVLSVTVQHELGHVVTLSGAFRVDADEDTWLSEGIAEYIGWKPKSAAQSLRRYSVRWQLDRSPMKSMVPAEPSPKAPARAGDAFYGLSHLAVDCMAHKYGEAKLLTFVRLVLTEDNELDQAARDAYGVPFKTVDRTCMAWIKKQV
jgi:hypothetical protein